VLFSGGKENGTDWHNLVTKTGGSYKLYSYKHPDGQECVAPPSALQGLKNTLDNLKQQLASLKDKLEGLGTRLRDLRGALSGLASGRT